MTLLEDIWQWDLFEGFQKSNSSPAQSLSNPSHSLILLPVHQDVALIYCSRFISVPVCLVMMVMN